MLEENAGVEQALEEMISRYKIGFESTVVSTLHHSTVEVLEENAGVEQALEEMISRYTFALRVYKSVHFNSC